MSSPHSSFHSPLRYLGWDTSSITGVVVAFEIASSVETGKEELKIIAEWSLSLETSRHSERLLWTIDVLLQSAGWELKDLSGLVVGVGPGSFTGLRIGVTTARILASQLKIPIVTISSLDLLARGASERLVLMPDHQKTLIVACTDATKGEWFSRIGNQKLGVVEATLTPEEVIEMVKSELKKSLTSKWLAVGQSILRYESEFKALPQKRRILISDPSIHQVQARILAILGFEAIQAGLLSNADTLVPRYLRASEAEVKLKNGILKPQKLASI